MKQAAIVLVLVTLSVLAFGVGPAPPVPQAPTIPPAGVGYPYAAVVWTPDGVGHTLPELLNFGSLHFRQVKNAWGEYYGEITVRNATGSVAGVALFNEDNEFTLLAQPLRE